MGYYSRQGLRRMRNRDFNKEIVTVQATGGGIGFFGLLTIVFVTLKLLGIITWSWLWVLSPLWIPFLFTIAIGFIILFIVTVWFIVTVFKRVL